LTGPSGAGKSAVLPSLRQQLPDWNVFETDLLWDSGGDWQMVRRNWLRIAYNELTEGGRPVLLAGIHVPEAIDACPERRYFGTVHYAALLCDAEVLEKRLRARPAWRGVTEEYIAEQKSLIAWLTANAATAFSPTLIVVDTTAQTVEETAEQVANWARRAWIGESKPADTGANQRSAIGT
jgi:hypothetical protein